MDTTETTGATPDANQPEATSGDQHTESGATSDDTALGHNGVKALQAERLARREAEKRAQEAEKRVAALEAENLRREVSTEKGVPADLLTGSTREELEAMADKLLEFKGEKSVPHVGRPIEALRPGAAGWNDEGPSYGRIADQIVNGSGL